MVTNILLRMVHIEMLSSYQTRDIMDFIHSFDKYDSSEWDQIWFEEGQLPISTHRIWIDGLVRWFNIRGINTTKFLDTMVKRLEKSEIIPARPILRSYLGFVSQFYTCSDIRELCLQLLPKRQAFLSNATVIKGKDKGATRNDFVVMKCKDEERLATNYMPWINFIIQNSPIFLNAPAFEDVSLCASQNSAVLTLDGRATVDIDGKIVSVNGKAIGEVVPFADCLKRNEISWDNDYEQTMECVHIKENFVDEKTGVTLLYKDCYYGAPVNISNVTYKTGVKVEDPMAKLLSSVVRQEFDVWKPLQHAHEDLLGALNDSVSVIYYKSDDSISVNTKHLMRNVPARILRNILREYSTTGREEYENREFKRDPEICMDPLRPNFESRLNRVVAHLEKVAGFFEIERHRRGGFRFVPKCRINFREE